jgi:hypothetical protein
MLTSPYPGVVKTAKLLITKYGIQDFDRIYEIYQTTKIENTKLKCAMLLYTASKWQRLIFMLCTLQSEEESLTEQSISAIRGWIGSFNRSYRQRTEKERQEISRLVNAQETLLGVEITNQLLFSLK